MFSPPPHSLRNHSTWHTATRTQQAHLPEIIHLVPDPPLVQGDHGPHLHQLIPLIRSHLRHFPHDLNYSALYSFVCLPDITDSHSIQPWRRLKCLFHCLFYFLALRYRIQLFVCLFRSAVILWITSGLASYLSFKIIVKLIHCQFQASLSFPVVSNICTCLLFYPWHSLPHIFKSLLSTIHGQALSKIS